MGSQICSGNAPAFAPKPNSRQSPAAQIFFSGILLEMRGAFKGKVLVSKDEEGKELIGEKAVTVECEDWQVFRIPCDVSLSGCAVYFRFSGEGECEMKSFGFLN